MRRAALFGLCVLAGLAARGAAIGAADGPAYAPLRITHCAPYWPATWATCREALPPAAPVVYCDVYAGLVVGCTWWPRTTSPYGPPTPAPAFVVGGWYQADDAPVLLEVLGHYLSPTGAVIWTGRTDAGLIVFVPAATGGAWTRRP